MTSALAVASATARAEPTPPPSPSSSAQPLRLDSDDGRASLFRIDPEVLITYGTAGPSAGQRAVEHWTRVCDAPCDAAVDRDGRFRVAGDGLTTSEPFSLGKNVKTLKVTAGSSGLRRFGIGAAVLGGFLTVSGLTLLTMTPNPTSPPPGWPASLGWDQPSGPSAALTWGQIVVGAILLLTGTTVALANSTVVEPSPSP
jgi:hypothetical protein